VLLSPDCADLFSQKVINASMGSFARVTVHTAALAEALAVREGARAGLRSRGRRRACAYAAARRRDCHRQRRPRPFAAVSARVTQRVTIPKYGGAESLNAAVAAAIVCDNLRRVERGLDFWRARPAR